MRLDRIMGVVLSILVIAFIYAIHDSSEYNLFELSSDKGYLVDNTFTFDGTLFNSNDSKMEVLEYKNTLNHPVMLNQNDITITCNGLSKEDEEIALKNYKVKASFTKNKNSKPDNSLLLDENEKAYIYIVSEYFGEMPENEVTCRYDISINSN